MAHTFKTDPWHVKEARVASHAVRPRTLPYTKARRDISKRIRARERREMERIARDMEAWGDYYPSGATLREFATDTQQRFKTNGDASTRWWVCLKTHSDNLTTTDQKPTLET